MARSSSKRSGARPFFERPHLRQRSYSQFSKRSFDIVVSLLGLLLTGPAWPLLALVVRKTPGALIFRQKRIGQGGELFTIYKLRTMRLDAEPRGQATWAQESDPRVTFVGRLLRDTRLDELPQLWNVLKGDMSIVGPRPERPELDAVLAGAIPDWRRRLLVKPGITGWAQVCNGYTANRSGAEAKLSYDLWYIRHRSLVLDIWVCLRTFPVLLFRSGAR
jgi:lipopolysaccharide/colanic/teichoic acid biosynthesis glycosyltransferase